MILREISLALEQNAQSSEEIVYRRAFQTWLLVVLQQIKGLCC